MKDFAKLRASKTVLSCLVSLALCIGLTPSLAFANDNTVEDANLDLQAARVDNSVLQAAEAADTLETPGVLTEGWTQLGTCEWRIDSSGRLTIRPLGDGESGILENDLESYHPWTNDSERILSAEIVGNIKAPSSLNSFFSNCTKMRTIEGLENLDVSSVRSMEDMFYSCSSLTALDVSNWQVSNVDEMSGMFASCKSLPILDVSKWDVSNVRSMRDMFDYCLSLTTLDVSKWDVSNVRSMCSMFRYCASLINLDVSKWNVSKVTNMSWMFNSCYLLAALDVSKWDVSNVINMSYMFSGDATSFLGTSPGCASLINLDVSKWNVSKVTNMSWMFFGCSSLVALDVSYWDTSNVESACLMFRNCSSLTALDLSNWNISAIKDITGMFSGCSSLKTLKLGGNGWQSSDNETELRDCIWASEDAQDKGPYTTVDLFAKYDPVTMAGTWTAIASPVTPGVKPDPAPSTSKSDISKATLSLSKTKVAYNGKAQTPAVTVKYAGKVLRNGTDYAVSYKNNKNAGTATVTVAGKGSFTGSKSATFKITKAKQPMTVKANAKTVKFAKVKKKAQTVTKAITVKKAQGALAYKNVSTAKAAKKLKVNAKTGKITVPKKTKKGTYSVKVKVTAKGNSNYNSGSKIVTVKVKVK